MHITKKQLKAIIKEELAGISEGGAMGHGEPEETAMALKDLMGALRAMGTQALTTSNLETIQGLLDHLKSVVGDRDVPLATSTPLRDRPPSHDYSRHSPGSSRPRSSTGHGYGGGGGFAEGMKPPSGQKY